MSQHWCQQNRPHPVFIHQSKQLTAERGTSHLVSWLSDAMLQTHIEKSTFNCIHQQRRDFGLGLSVVRIMQKICISLKFCKWQGLETVGWIWGWLSAVSVNTANAVEVGTRFLSIRYTVFPHELPAAKSPGKMVRPCKELSDIAATIGLPNVNDIIAKRRLALFGHVVRLDTNTPAHQILKQGMDVKSGHRPNAQWQRPPGRPHNSWLQQTNKGSLTAMRQSWRAAEDRGLLLPTAAVCALQWWLWWWYTVLINYVQSWWQFAG